jgi:hypothetical protein
VRTHTGYGAYLGYSCIMNYWLYFVQFTLLFQNAVFTLKQTGAEKQATTRHNPKQTKSENQKGTNTQN